MQRYFTVHIHFTNKIPNRSEHELFFALSIMARQFVLVLVTAFVVGLHLGCAAPISMRTNRADAAKVIAQASSESNGSKLNIESKLPKNSADTRGLSLFKHRHEGDVPVSHRGTESLKFVQVNSNGQVSRLYAHGGWAYGRIGRSHRRRHPPSPSSAPSSPTPLPSTTPAIAAVNIADIGAVQFGKPRKRGAFDINTSISPHIHPE